jgi:predicted FMN-binding regulatory protein PaiB
MYLPTVFAEKDAAFIADFVDRHPLGWRGVKFNEGVDQIVTKPPIREG